MVKKAKEDLTEEIEPQIEELIERAKKGLKALERQQHVLKTKVRDNYHHISNANWTAGRTFACREGDCSSRARK